MSFLVVGAEEICPNENLEEIIVEFRFIEDKLSAINLIALNDADNSTSNKLTLMKYVKRVYGQFDSGDNPKAYVGYELYKKTNFFVVYQRMVGEDKIINEEVYISNAEQDEKLRIALAISAPENEGPVEYAEVQEYLEELAKEQSERIELLPIINLVR